MELKALLKNHRKIRAVGFDDAPFMRNANKPVGVAGVICADTRFEGMVWGEIQPDGWDATEKLCQLLIGGKFLPHLHIVLLDGISLGGFNIVDLPLLAERLERPCIAVMRKQPKLNAMIYAMQRLPHPEKRLETILHAGTVYEYPPFYFQVYGAEPDVTAQVLQRLTDCGHVPEALRLAHLITSAVVKGESGRQA
ncbi:hypothetical protein NIES21_21130 [Anabaenopsis circularis NIES-21]|uniref:Uncharacterized protein n=1 Tax=Anabaenopsis circularis NIES-21 TaxID=1085406 RepID=A0A1Z4GG19_9CYAN|nr:hypothetical protein NIES21_21130 [Anabaenopsis circularis NIES-21]